MEIQTHPHIDPELCGTPVKLGGGYSLVSLETTPRMGVDALGLVHGGFIFALADFAAMIAVNHPHVVLAGASVSFLKPVRVGDAVLAEARVKTEEGRRHSVHVQVTRDDERVFEGTFTCLVLKYHVLASSQA